MTSPPATPKTEAGGDQRRPLVIGVSGGIASGKSSVARTLEQFGAVRIDADQIAHRVLETDIVRSQLIDRWGQRVVSDDGRLSRSAIAQIVFAPTESSRQELKWLERVTHPKIALEIRNAIDQAGRDGVPAVVLDAALLFEGDWHKQCDLVVFVETSDAIRQQRALSRGWSIDEVARRESRQWSLDRKRNNSQVVLNNDDDEQILTETLRTWWTKTLAENPTGRDLAKVLPSTEKA